MSKTNKSSESGFTFLELMVCFAILMMIVLPVCTQFMSGLNQRHFANAINEATAYGEKMLEDVKTQITSDITTLRSMEGNKKKEDASAMRGTANYLSSTHAKGLAELKTFFSGMTDDEIKTAYNTDKFSYEVGLWRAEDIDFTANDFTLTTDIIDDAAKLYTDGAHRFDGSDITGMNLPINLKLVDDEYLKVNTVGPDVVDVNTISFEGIDPENISTTDKNNIDITSKSNKITVECESVMQTSSGKSVGYTFKIKSGSALGSSDSEKSSIIELDVRKLMRKINNTTEAIEYEDLDSRDITFKFINDTTIHQVIELKQNLAGSETIEGNNDIFNIVVENDTGDTAGKVTILKKDDKSPHDNYIIGVIIREKDPAIGTAGKIIKKMVDIYSYDLTLD